MTKRLPMSIEVVPTPPRVIGKRMEAFVVPMGVVAFSEMGNKTQRVADLFSVKFRRLVLIVDGIVVATLLNHTAAGALRDSGTAPEVLRWFVGCSLISGRLPPSHWRHGTSTCRPWSSVPRLAD